MDKRINRKAVTAAMLMLIIGIILVLIMIVIFFPSILQVADFVYDYGCEGWTTLMNAVYDTLGMPMATAAC